MLKHLAGVAVVLAGATIAWFILGATIAVRTQDSDSAQRGQLAATWGSEQVQIAARFSLPIPKGGENGDTTDRRTVAPDCARASPSTSRSIRAKGLPWYNTYGVPSPRRTACRIPLAQPCSSISVPVRQRDVRPT